MNSHSTLISNYHSSSFGIQIPPPLISARFPANRKKAERNSNTPSRLGQRIIGVLEGISCRGQLEPDALDKPIAARQITKTEQNRHPVIRKNWTLADFPDQWQERRRDKNLPQLNTQIEREERHSGCRFRSNSRRVRVTPMQSRSRELIRRQTSAHRGLSGIATSEIFDANIDDRGCDHRLDHKAGT